MAVRTENFRKQHREILEIAEEIGKHLKLELLSKDASQARSLLSKLVGKVSMHLSMEDDSLYPELIKSPDKNVSETAKRLQQEMGGIKEAFTAYVQKWPNPLTIQAKASDFIKETQGIFSALSKRIELEEKDLYPLADKLE